MFKSIVPFYCVIVLALPLFVAVVYSDSREDEILRSMEEFLEMGVEKLNEGGVGGAPPGVEEMMRNMSPEQMEEFTKAQQSASGSVPTDGVGGPTIEEVD